VCYKSDLLLLSVLLTKHVCASVVGFLFLCPNFLVWESLTLLGTSVHSGIGGGKKRRGLFSLGSLDAHFPGTVCELTPALLLHFQLLYENLLLLLTFLDTNNITTICAIATKLQ